MSTRPGLPPEQVDVVFPFHVLVGADLRIRGVGPSLARTCPDLTPGTHLLDRLTFRRPFQEPSFEAMASSPRSVFVFEHENGLVLKGQAVPLEDDVLLIACSPWITALDELGALGLTVRDFAVHDPVTDYLLLLQAKDTSLRDLDELTAVLREQREQLRAAEDAMRRARDQAEAASRAKSEFLATVSHEIRTPMNAILGMTALARDTEEPSERRRYLGRVLVNAQSLLHLLNDMLDISKVEAGQMDLDVAPFSPLRVVGSVTSSLSATAAGRGLELIVDVVGDVPSRLQGDSNRFRQVLLNLVGNAVKFTNHGEIVVRVRADKNAPPRTRVDRDADVDVNLAHGTNLTIEVEDTGPGIPEEDIDRIFNKFAQSRTDRDASLAGTGLGLAISRSIARLMNGDVTATSVLGEGSTFTFTAQFDEAPEARIRPSAAAQRGDGRVLVSASSSALRGAWTRALGAAGYSVVSGEDAADVRALLESSGPIDVLCLAADAPGTLPMVQVLCMAQRSDPSVPGLVLLRGGTQPPLPVPSSARVQQLSRPVMPSELVEATGQVRGRVPLARWADPDTTWSGADLSPAPRLHILVAEDNPDNREILTLYLRRQGHTTVGVPNGADAVEAVQKEVFDLVMLDLDMPVLGGLDALAAIRTTEKSLARAPVPVVAVSAHALAETRAQCLAAGMEDFIAKPAPPREIVRVGERVADRRPVVLVVDDNVDNRMLYSTFLARSGKVRPWSIDHGSAVLPACARRDVALVLLDMEMPEVSGYEVARRLVERENSPPAIAVTGHDGPAARRACLDAGCAAHLPKPIGRRDLLRAVADHLDTAAT